jgi:hypothetical protein
LKYLLRNSEFIDAITNFRRRWLEKAGYSPELTQWLDPFARVPRSDLIELLRDYTVLAGRYDLNQSPEVAKRLLHSACRFDPADDAEQLLTVFPADLVRVEGNWVSHRGRCSIVRGVGTEDRIPFRSMLRPFGYDLTRLKKKCRFLGVERIEFSRRENGLQYSKRGTDFLFRTPRTIRWLHEGGNVPPRGCRYTVQLRYAVNAPIENSLACSQAVLSFLEIEQHYLADDLLGERVLFIPVDAATQRNDLIEFWPLIEKRLQRIAAVKKRRRVDRRLRFVELEHQVEAGEWRRGTKQFNRELARRVVVDGGALVCTGPVPHHWYPLLDGGIGDTCPMCLHTLRWERDWDALVHRLKMMRTRTGGD